MRSTAEKAVILAIRPEQKTNRIDGLLVDGLAFRLVQAVNPSSRPVTRRTQQARRDATQRVLLDATVSALCELGYVGTTTLEVERRAGVSRGARIHHFPTKAALLASAVDHLYSQLSEHYDEAFGTQTDAATQRAASEHERFRTGLRLLWSIYSRRDYTAVLELQMAARTDAELRQHLRAVGERHRTLAIQAAQRCFPVLEPERALALIETLHAVLVGMLMQRPLATHEQVAEQILTMLDDVFELHLEKARNRRV
jgi:AcrR family transcriptional regulator